MITYKDYFSILEELRIEKKITVEDLCENIISVRTYYRYLSDVSAINVNVFIKLLQRLNINLSSLTLYGVHFRKEDTGITRFVFRVHAKSYHDIRPIYKRVLKIEKKDSVSSLCLQAFILEYERDIGLVTSESYYKQILEIVEKVKNHSKKDIQLVSIYLNLLEIEPNNEYITLDEVTDLLTKIDFKMNAMHYFISLERTLKLLLKDKSVTKEKYNAFLNHAKMIFKHFYFRDTMMNYALYEAYSFKYNHDEKQIVERLYKYAMYSLSRYGKNQIREVMGMLSKVFGIEYESFLVSQTKIREKSSHIQLID